jgi:hypothetical protein
MLVVSHYHIGGFVYRHVISKYFSYSHIKKLIFQAGNLMPDLSQNLSILKHNIKGSSMPFNFHVSKAQDSTLPARERLVSMGIVCHYLSDYFCIYHSKEPYTKFSIIRHLIYELRLHLMLICLLPFSEKLISQISGEIISIESKKSEKAATNFNIDNADIHDILNYLQKHYHSKKSTIKNDIKFTLMATILSTDFVMKQYAATYPKRIDFETVAALYSVPEAS